MPATLDRASLLTAVRRLARRDPALGRIVRRHGPPPLWARPRGFSTLLRIILEQQVSLASARAMFTRLGAALPAVTPETVLGIGRPGLQALGFTRQKASYACALAERVADGTLALARLARLPDEEARARLMEVPGIGPWTADIYLLMALRRPDVWPPGDLALVKAVAALRRHPLLMSSAEAEIVSCAWRPYRAVAARILWHGYLSERAA